ncbi:hypothetical protein [Paracidobacterium acidisoli]|uniref:hypothetical protein n=1 Tax=Paracidobacterium acidisoli TaxID=2303751 RepID=UPI001314FA2F|nr:hypothetical protein [Paracidobacterium acidisoli]MBT9332361.1 hypothetical protein [Paracidobacterium acidisoli]
MNAAGRSAFIQSKIESPAVEERKHIVEEGILIWKINHAAGRYDEEVWDKLLIFLRKLIMGFPDIAWNHTGFARVCRREPKNYICIGVVPAAAIGPQHLYLYLRSNLRAVSIGRSGQQDASGNAD